MMKKKTVVMIAALAAVVLMSGCGKSADAPAGGASAASGSSAADTSVASDSGESSETPSSGSEESSVASSAAPEVDPALTLNGMGVEKYVKLGDYSSFKVEVATVGVDEEILKGMMSEWYKNYITPENGGITNRAVVKGDAVRIDYEGKLNGEAFAGGTAQDANLTIGSGQFIDGFEDGLVGVMPGKTVDLNLTFPKEYKNNPDLAGKKVVFTVTVQCILPQFVAEKDMKDAVIASIGLEGVDTVAQFRQYSYDYLNKEYESEVQGKMLDILQERCEFQELPEEVMEIYRREWTQLLSDYAPAYQMTLDELAESYGMKVDEFVEQYAEFYLKQDMIFQAIANKEGLGVSDEELQSMLQKAASDAGKATVEEYVGAASREDFRNNYMSDKVMKYLMERTKVSKSGK